MLEFDVGREKGLEVSGLKKHEEIAGRVTLVRTPAFGSWTWYVISREAT